VKPAQIIYLVDFVNVDVKKKKFLNKQRNLLTLKEVAFH